MLYDITRRVYNLTLLMLSQLKPPHTKHSSTNTAKTKITKKNVLLMYAMI